MRIKLFLIHINKTVNVTSVKQKEAKFILVLHFKMHWFYILKYFVPPSHRVNMLKEELKTGLVCYRQAETCALLFFVFFVMFHVTLS